MNVPTEQSMPTMATDAIDSLGRVPVVVGATGHRFLAEADLPLIEQAVIEALRYFQQKLPSSPLWLLSGLAEGADQLVARCALEFGWQLHALIPDSAQAFESTMSSDEARQMFRGLLARCTSVRTIVPSSNEAEQRYVDVAHFLCMQSQWLIALWDGQPSGGRGGTAEVVREFTQGVPADDGFLPDTGPVMHVQVRRAPSDMSPVPVGTIKLLPPNPLGMDTGRDAAMDQWYRIMARIDEFNQLSLRYLAKERPSLLVHRATLGQPLVSEFDSASRLDRIGWLYAVTDRLAQFHQTRRIKAFRWMLGWSLLAIIAEQLYFGPMSDAPWTLHLTVLFVIFALAPEVMRRLSGFWGKGGDEAAYLDCRALAEACRVQYYWRLNGIHDSVADAYVVNQRDELEWIRQAVRSNDIASELPDFPPQESLAITLQHWIIGQRIYFLGEDGQANKVTAKLKKEARFDALVATLLGLTLLLLMVAEIALLGGWAGQMALIQMGWGIALGGAVTVKLYQRTLAYREHARRDARMVMLTKIAENGLTRQSDAEIEPSHARDVLRAYGRLALQENGNWLMLLRDRPTGPSLGA